MFAKEMESFFQKYVSHTLAELTAGRISATEAELDIMRTAVKGTFINRRAAEGVALATQERIDERARNIEALAKDSAA